MINATQIAGIDSGDYVVINGGTCVVLPDESWVHGALSRTRLIESYPFNFWEVCYRKRGHIYVPHGFALDAKRLSLRVWLGPLRLEMKRPFSIPKGGGFDPVFDQRGRMITHRKRRKDGTPTLTQHSFQPARWNRCTGTAWDFRPKGCDERMREEIVVWLKKRSVEHLVDAFGVPDGFADIRAISIGVYGDENGNFDHGDLRPDTPARWRTGAPKPKSASWWPAQGTVRGIRAAA